MSSTFDIHNHVLAVLSPEGISLPAPMLMSLDPSKSAPSKQGISHAACLTEIGAVCACGWQPAWDHDGWPLGHGLPFETLLVFYRQLPGRVSPT